MVPRVKKIVIETPGSGLLEITDEVSSLVKESNIAYGLCTVFIQHTSASLLIQENADPSARADLETWIDRLVSQDDSLYTHVSEGPDDMTSHIKSAITNTSLSVPVMEGRLALGTWQGIYLWEHRSGKRKRTVVVHVA